MRRVVLLRVVRCSLISIGSSRFFFCRRRLRMNVSPFSCVSIKKLLFRLLFSRRQIALRERKKRDLSLSLFFCVCLLFRVSNFGRERERERGLVCLSLSLSFASLFVEEKKNQKKRTTKF